MEMDVVIRELFPSLLDHDRIQLEEFLKENDLQYEEDIEYACCGILEDGSIAACGCCAGNILKCFAILPGMRGQNLMSRIISLLLSNRFAAGISRLFVYTKPEYADLFENCGFSLLAKTDAVAMLENTAGGIDRYLRPILAKRKEPGSAGAVVVNCNPFTLGHRYLIEYAASHCPFLHVFVVEEDHSVFPFSTRIRLVREGTAHLPHLAVHPSGPYMISGATFPKYFLKEDTDAAAVQARLDLTLFAEKIAPALRITTRFVGEEPLSASTDRYNRIMRDVLPAHGIAVAEIPRRSTESGEIISATTVRQCIAERGAGEWLRLFVPESTYRYLTSPEAREVLAKLSAKSGVPGKEEEICS